MSTNNKIFKRIITFIIAVIMFVGVLSGCQFFTLNTDKDLAQVIATVGEGDYIEEITKRDLVVFFLNNGGSNYISQGYEAKEVFESFLEQLINRKLFVVEARKNLDKIGTSGDYRLGEYFDATEIKRFEDTVKKNERDKLLELEEQVKEDWYGPSPSSDASPSPSPTPRPTPTPPTASPAPTPLPPLEDYPLPTASQADKDIAAETKLRLKRQIEADKKTEEEYFIELVESQIEQGLIEKYREVIYGGTNDILTEQVLVERLANLIAQQKEEYQINPASYMQKIVSRSEDNFIVYYPMDGYFTVKNLLVKFSDEVTAALTAIKGTVNEAAYNNLRLQLAAALQGKDLRDEENLPEGESLDTVVYDLEFDQNGRLDITKGFYKHISDLVSAPTTEAEKIQMFVDLIFKYGEDTGMFNNVYDYVVGPTPALGENESFVKEFADAARFLNERGKVGDITYCVSDYGVHIIMLTGHIPVDYKDQYIHAERDVFGTFSYRFYQFAFNEQKTALLTKLQRELSNEYYENDRITKYTSRYENLYK